MIGKGLLRALASIQPSDVWLPYKTINKRSLQTWKGGWCLHHPFRMFSDQMITVTRQLSPPKTGFQSPEQSEPESQTGPVRLHQFLRDVIRITYTSSGRLYVLVSFPHITPMKTTSKDGFQRFWTLIEGVYYDSQGRRPLGIHIKH